VTCTAILEDYKGFTRHMEIPYPPPPTCRFPVAKRETGDYFGGGLVTGVIHFLRGDQLYPGCYHYKQVEELL
jgi:hypothetical protein